MGIHARMVKVTALVPTMGPLADAIDFYTRHMGFGVARTGSK